MWVQKYIEQYLLHNLLLKNLTKDIIFKPLQMGQLQCDSTHQKNLSFEILSEFNDILNFLFSDQKQWIKVIKDTTINYKKKSLLKGKRKQRKLEQLKNRWIGHGIISSKNVSNLFAIFLNYIYWPQNLKISKKIKINQINKTIQVNISEIYIYLNPQYNLIDKVSFTFIFNVKQQMNNQQIKLFYSGLSLNLK